MASKYPHSLRLTADAPSLLPRCPPLPCLLPCLLPCSALLPPLRCCLPALRADPKTSNRQVPYPEAAVLEA
jgi:hypothetical protein